MNQSLFQTKLKKTLKPLYKQYFTLKNALAADDLNKAKQAGQNLRKELKDISASLFKGDAKEKWNSLNNALTKATEHIHHYKDLEEFRKSFLTISKIMINITKAFSPSDKVIFVQHCPMAFNDKGGDWLSEEKEILNPYFGASMLKCGEVIEEIK